MTILLQGGTDARKFETRSTKRFYQKVKNKNKPDNNEYCKLTLNKNLFRVFKMLHKKNANLAM